MISFCPLLAAEASPFTAERTKRGVTPEVPLGAGLARSSSIGARAASAFPRTQAVASGKQPMPFLLHLASRWENFVRHCGIHGAS